MYKQNNKNKFILYKLLIEAFKVNIGLKLVVNLGKRLKLVVNLGYGFKLVVNLG